MRSGTLLGPIDQILNGSISRDGIMHLVALVFRGFAIGLSAVVSLIAGAILVLERLGVATLSIKTSSSFSPMSVFVGSLVWLAGLGLLLWFTGSSRDSKEVETKESWKELGSKSIEQYLNRALNILDEDIATLSRKIALLDNHSTEYFNALNTCGWSRLVRIQEGLTRVRRDVDFLIGDRQLESAQELVDFLLNKSRHFFPALCELTSTNLTILQDWRVDSERYIRKIMVTLSSESEKNRSIGVRRTRSRSTTFHSLGELRRIISGESCGPRPTRGTSFGFRGFVGQSEASI